MDNVYLVYAIAVLFIFLFVIVKKRYNYWTDRGIYTLERVFILGNIRNGIELLKTPMSYFYQNIYNELGPKRKFAGYFIFHNPKLMIRDPELIKLVLVKDFDHFRNRNMGFYEENEPITNHLFSAFDEKWRNLRVNLTPTFTSGKMKLLFELMKSCAEQLTTFAERSAEIEDELEMKELMANYTTQVISSCAFGLDADSIANPDSKFRQIGRRLGLRNFRNRIFGIINTISPAFRRLLQIRVVDKQVTEFLTSIVEQTVKYREENDIKRNDFLGLLIDLKNENKSTESEENKSSKNKIDMNINLMTAQCFLFFVAGFDTSSVVSSFALLELARHPDIQKKLHEEVDKVWEEYNGNICYESLQKVPYLEKVIFETMRLYPVLPILMRQCSKEYRISDNNSSYLIEKGTNVIIPVYGLHHDPQYFPNPELFDPERFSEESKAARHHFAYLPFGEGPRNCIGLRFGMMQVKLVLIMLMRHYKLELSSKTELPIRIAKSHIVIKCEGEIWVKFSKRR